MINGFKKTIFKASRIGISLLAYKAFYGNIDQANPYAVIAERNVFWLVASPPASVSPPSSAPVKVTPKLTGIVKAAGQRPRAFFACATSRVAAYFSLCEGERDLGLGLEVVNIREADEAADVVSSGNRPTVWLRDSGGQSLPRNVH